MVTPLPLYPYPAPVTLEALRSAKVEANITETLQPCPAVPGNPGVVLAWERPPFLCDAVAVGAFPSLGAALAAWAKQSANYTVLDYLKAQFGAEVREVVEA